ncbi:MAG: hypothetical protein ACE5ET_01645 [Gammaproteobacteria bacterium]
MLKSRLIIKLILAALLVSNMAWAWSSHAGVYPVDRAATVSVVDGGGAMANNTVQGDEATALSCNHHYCSHGAAHLSGLLSPAVPLTAFQAESVHVLPPPFPPSPSLALPFKPPRC